MRSQENPILSRDEEHSVFLKSVKLYSNGLSFVRDSGSRYNNSRHLRSPEQIIHDKFFNHKPRGEIKCFSRHASLRLRRALVSMSSSFKGSCVGITLTLPFKGDFNNKGEYKILARAYKIAFNRFGVSMRRRFSSSCGIFRHELQRRRVPHCHVVFFLSDIDFKLVHFGRNSNIDDLRAIVYSYWLSALQGFTFEANLKGFVKHGIKLDKIDTRDNIAFFRYLCDHASKHKREQLGYLGKQWGFINRALFVPSPSVEVSFRNTHQKNVFVRHVRKCCRYTVKAKCVFKHKLTRVGRLKGCYFVGVSTTKKIVKAVRDSVIC